MERLAVDEMSGAPLRFARRRLGRTAGRRRSASAEGPRAAPAPEAARGQGGPPGGRGQETPEPEGEQGRLPSALQGKDGGPLRGASGLARNNNDPVCLCSEEGPLIDAAGEEASSSSAEKDQQRMCEQALTPCRFGCGQVVAEENFADHLQNGCAGSTRLRNCNPTDPYNGQQNLTVVISREDGCRFSRIGCSFKGDAEDRESHERDALGVHLGLLLQHVTKLTACLCATGGGVEEGLTGQGGLSSFDPMSWDFPEGEFLSGLPLYEEGEPWQRPSTKTQGVSLLETKLQVFDNLVSVLSKEMAVARQKFVAFRGQRGLDQDMIRGLELKIADLQRSLVQKDAALGRLEERFYVSKDVSYDGVFLWKVTDAHQKCYEAVCGKRNSLQSPVFYTSRFGYKLCLRMYLNGEGRSKGTHLSLFFALLKGDYDALLPWPFSHKVTFTLLDQNDGEHFVNTIHPDPASPSFQRPAGEMNEAGGFSRFIPLAKMQSPKYAYMKDGTIFLRCEVHGSS